ncbi:hypothetical protein [Burkholderia diffusa]|uniref:hypothetical protein n=1 Tax=Burkholderia diffusa TaxID=488732 RepID=UPI0009BEF7DF|nr:hypothetical protein [Burkholderia diffusa]
MRWKTLFLGALLSVFGSMAHASDYGCKVLLCLANPNGPKAVSECVPPIDQLFDDLSHGRAFPTCDMAEGPNGKSYAKQGFSYYDPCPDGTTALSSGAYAIQGTSTPSNPWNYNSSVYMGIGTGDGLTPSYGDGGSGLSQKVCVGNRVGQTMVVIGSGEDSQYVQAGVYDTVRLLDVQGSPRIIDVFIDNNLYRRVRW